MLERQSTFFTSYLELLFRLDNITGQATQNSGLNPSWMNTLNPQEQSFFELIAKAKEYFDRSAESRKTRLVDFPEFKGGNQDPVEWLKVFEKACDANKVLENRKLNQWKHQLRNRKQKSGETVEDYIVVIEELWKRVDPQGKRIELNKIHEFIEGLRPEFIVPVQSAMPETAEEAMDRARALETALSLNMKLSVYSLISDYLQNINGGMVPAKTSQIRTESKLYQNNQGRNSGCYLCGKSEHIAKNCRQRSFQNNGNNGNNNNNNQRNNNNNRQNIECYNCRRKVPGGKVELGELSIQAVLRETQEETGINLKKEELTYLFNDPNFNCDIYATKLISNQKLEHTKPDKQGPWELFNWNNYKEMANQKLTIPTHVTYIEEILKSLVKEKSTYVHQIEEVKEALFGKAEVYEEKVNVLIDSGAVGCIISKRYLDKVDKAIDTSTSVRIIDVTGKKTAPLELVRQVPIKIRDIEIRMDMIVTESQEYNVLLRNIWLKYVNVIINYNDNTMRIKWELELEEEEEDLEPIPYYNLKIDNEEFQIEDCKYSVAFMEYCEIKYRTRDRTTNSQGPGRCLCKILKDQENCLECCQIE
ncbi:hypothetical protein GLOIN_2v1772369 [Rhizophagus clarus]|uniref:CCHC-type domain-containing protein n=1 Tax=Rhizophagus clarus TaxID=94130 RepID=A0A8H3LM25_9GLOM|nr:hypothetical protein GLOIN_2v1772369 [Rhizophagus clarus]